LLFLRLESLFSAKNLTGKTPLALAVSKMCLPTLKWFNKKYPAAFTVTIHGLNLFQHMLRGDNYSENVEINLLRFFHQHYPNQFMKPQIAICVMEQETWSAEEKNFAMKYGQFPEEFFLIKILNSSSTWSSSYELLVWVRATNKGYYVKSSEKIGKICREAPHYPAMLRGDKIPPAVYKDLQILGGEYMAFSRNVGEERNIFNYATVFRISAWLHQEPSSAWVIDQEDWKIMYQYLFIYWYLNYDPEEKVYQFPNVLIKMILGYAANHPCEEITALVICDSKICDSKIRKQFITRTWIQHHEFDETLFSKVEAVIAKVEQVSTKVSDMLPCSLYSQASKGKESTLAPFKENRLSI